MFPISGSEVINCTSDNMTTRKGWPLRAGDSSCDNSTALLDRKEVSNALRQPKRPHSPQIFNFRKEELALITVLDTHTIHSVRFFE